MEVHVHLLAVLAVHHPHLPANLVLQLSQQKRVCMGHNCTLLQPYMRKSHFKNRHWQSLDTLVFLMPPCVHSVQKNLPEHSSFTNNPLPLVLIGHWCNSMLFHHRESCSTFVQTLSNFLCLVTKPCAVAEVERQTGFWQWVLSLFAVHH